jgi:CheY-like chemotaxis protein
MQASSTVLIVDDEPIAREGLEALLTGEGYRLEFAGNGLEGLAKAAELLPDVILLDIV